MVIKAFTGRLQESDVWAMDRALRIKTVFQDYIENRYVKPRTHYVGMRNKYFHSSFH